MTGKDWINSVWPYAIIIGAITGLSINWMWDQTCQQRKDAKVRHPSNRFHHKF